MINKIIEAYKKNPRDVHTIPISNKKYIWFHVCVENNDLLIESAHEIYPSSTIKRHKMKVEECDKMYELYKRRKQGENVSKEATNETYYQVYWYGIFSNFGL